MNISGPTDVELPKQYQHLKTLRGQQGGADTSLRGGTVKIRACAPPPSASNAPRPATKLARRPVSGPTSDGLTPLSFAPPPGQTDASRQAAEKLKEQRRIEKEKQMIAQAKAEKAREKEEAARKKALEEAEKARRAPPPPAPVNAGPQTAVAKFDFDAQQSGDLSFKKGDKISVTNTRCNGSDQWWSGELKGRKGMFPSTYVELTDASGKSNSQSAKDVAAAQKKAEENARKEAQKREKDRQAREKEEAKRREAQQKEEAKRRKAEQKAAEKHRKDAEKAQRKAEKNSGKNEDLGTALFDFEAQQAGDLSFKKGAEIKILSRSHKGSAEWWQGQVNGRTGVFPSSYVKAGPAPNNPPPPPRPVAAPVRNTSTTPVSSSSIAPAKKWPPTATSSTPTPAPYLRPTSSNATVRGPTPQYVPQVTSSTPVSTTKKWGTSTTSSSSTKPPAKKWGIFGGSSTGSPTPAKKWGASTTSKPAPAKKWGAPAAKSTPTPAAYLQPKVGATQRAPVQGFVPPVAYNARPENFKAKVKPAPVATTNPGRPGGRGKLNIPSAFR